MRTTIPVSITLPPEMLKRAKKLAGKENRTMSELMREAYREYERKERWDDINEYGRVKAAALRITEKDVPGIVKQWRKEQRQKTKQRSR